MRLRGWENGSLQQGDWETEYARSTSFRMMVEGYSDRQPKPAIFESGQQKDITPQHRDSEHRQQFGLTEAVEDQAHQHHD